MLKIMAGLAGMSAAIFVICCIVFFGIAVNEDSDTIARDTFGPATFIAAIAFTLSFALTMLLRITI